MMMMIYIYIYIYIYIINLFFKIFFLTIVIVIDNRLKLTFETVSSWLTG